MSQLGFLFDYQVFIGNIFFVVINSYRFGKPPFYLAPHQQCGGLFINRWVDVFDSRLVLWVYLWVCGKIGVGNNFLSVLIF